jgi:hypothetical protein
MMYHMAEMTGEEIIDWISAINQLNENTVTDGTANFESHGSAWISRRRDSGRKE